MPDWTCQRSGECCASSPVVGMTRGELAAVQAVSAVPVIVTEVGDGRVEVMAATGGSACAYWADGCTVYDVRPGVCRAYGCFRRPGEPYGGVEGMIARLHASAGVRRVAFRMADEAEAWTREHA